jgi:hypothetical protein
LRSEVGGGLAWDRDFFRPENFPEKFMKKKSVGILHGCFCPAYKLFTEDELVIGSFCEKEAFFLFLA